MPIPYSKYILGGEDEYENEDENGTEEYDMLFGGFDDELDSLSAEEDFYEI